jgi:hypothetical protein
MPDVAMGRVIIFITPAYVPGFLHPPEFASWINPTVASRLSNPASGPAESIFSDYISFLGGLLTARPGAEEHSGAMVHGRQAVHSGSPGPFPFDRHGPSFSIPYHGAPWISRERVEEWSDTRRLRLPPGEL